MSVLLPIHPPQLEDDTQRVNGLGGRVTFTANFQLLEFQFANVPLWPTRITDYASFSFSSRQTA